MTRIIEEHNTSRRPRRKRRFLKASTIFVIVMLAYSVLHFLLMWVGVNFNSILLSFKTYKGGSYHWLTGSRFFENFELIFMNISKDVDNYRSMLFSSLAFFVVSCFVTLPISLIL